MTGQKAVLTNAMYAGALRAAGEVLADDGALGDAIENAVEQRLEAMGVGWPADAESPLDIVCYTLQGDEEYYRRIAAQERRQAAQERPQGDATSETGK